MSWKPLQKTWQPGRSSSSIRAMRTHSPACEATSQTYSRGRPFSGGRRRGAGCRPSAVRTRLGTYSRSAASRITSRAGPGSQPAGRTAAAVKVTAATPDGTTKVWYSSALPPCRSRSALVTPKQRLGPQAAAVVIWKPCPCQASRRPARNDRSAGEPGCVSAGRAASRRRGQCIAVFLRRALGTESLRKYGTRPASRTWIPNQPRARARG